MIQIESVFSQIEISGSTEKVIHEMENAIKLNNNMQYNCKMLFKEFGGDTFEIQNFTVNYKENESNKLYGYDYAISRILSDGYLLTFMALEDFFYIVDESAKTMFKNDLPIKVTAGNYFENKKRNLVIADVIQPFLVQPFNVITLADSNNTVFIEYNESELSKNQIYLDKNTFLPLKYRNIFKESDFGFTQTLEILFSYEDQSNNLTDSLLSLNYYLLKGYKLMDKTSNKLIQEASNTTISTEDQNKILNYIFVSSKGDSTKISDFSNSYIILDFWYASCMPCLKSMPKLDTLAGSYKPSDLKVIGINCYDIGIKENLESKLKSKISNMKFLYGSRDFLESLNISSFPTYYLILPDRSITLINGGIDKVKEVIETLLKKN